MITKERQAQMNALIETIYAGYVSGAIDSNQTFQLYNNDLIEHGDIELGDPHIEVIAKIGNQIDESIVKNMRHDYLLFLTTRAITPTELPFKEYIRESLNYPGPSADYATVKDTDCFWRTVTELEQMINDV